MRLIKIGLANIDTTVGAMKSNTKKAIWLAKKMAEEKVTVGCFQEQTISGYPCEDLIQWASFVEQQWESLQQFVFETESCETVFTIGVTVAIDGKLYNCVAVVHQGSILGIVPKEKLPTYNVFYEARTFSYGVPGLLQGIAKNGCLEDVPFGDLVFKFAFGTLAVEICEDIWSPDGPMRRRAYCGAELIINSSASPFRAGVVNTRREMISTRASDNQVVVAYVNQYGGQDSLVFDGGGFICQNGRMLLEAPRWQEGYVTQIVDLDVTRNSRERNTTWRTDASNFLASVQSKSHMVIALDSKIWPEFHHQFIQEMKFPTNHSFFLPQQAKPSNAVDEYYEDLLQGMLTGLAGYFEKTGAFRKIGIALSGGKDSVLTLIVAWLYACRKFGSLPEEQRRKAIRDFIWCFSMPTRYNSDQTRDISRIICAELGVSFQEVSIEEAFGRELAATTIMLGEEPSTVTVQNIQARIRGSRMWNWANSASGLWLQTGNMSERAVGYTTIGGDMMGGYSLIGNLPKTVVIALLQYLADSSGNPCPEGLQQLLATKASAELADNQSDEDDLMPFPVLDACFYLFAERNLSPVELYLQIRQMFSDDDLRRLSSKYEAGMLKVWVKRFVVLFANSIFKWVQAPQTVHLGSLDLDRERALQLPVVQSKEWLNLEALDFLPD